MKSLKRGLVLGNPFTEEKLDRIFKTLKSDSVILKNKESQQIEYKKSFSMANIDEYLRLFCSFANFKGAYIIFGIENETRKMVGLKNDKFEKIDSSRITQCINGKLSEGLKWEACIHELNGMKFGIIYIHPSQMKPVMCISNSSKFKESEIYYRYGGETRLIRPTELQKIIGDRIKKERKSWQNLLNKIASISPEEAFIADSSDGSIDFQGKKIYIDEDLLSQLNIMKEGQFHEEEGTPIYKLKEEIENISGVFVTKTKPKAIHRNEFYDAFFGGKCDYPNEYLKSLVYETSYYLPLWFFIKKSGKNLEEICNMLSSVRNCNRHVQRKVLERIKSDSTDNLRLGSTFPKITFNEWDLRDIEKICSFCRTELDTKSRKKVLRSVIKEFISHDPKFLKQKRYITKNRNIIIESITHIPPDAIRKDFEAYKEMLSSIKELELDGGQSLGTNFRKAVCYIDYCYYGNP